MLTKGTVVAKVAATNIIPPMLAPAGSTYCDIPQYEGEEASEMPILGNVPQNQNKAEQWPLKPELTQEQLDKLFSKLDLKGIEEWPESDQNEVCELMKEYQHLFTLDDTESG